MADTPGSPVASTTELSVNPVGNLPLPLDRDVACLSSMLADKQLSENSQTVAILLAILHGITKNTTSGDVLSLSLYDAQDTCEELGVDPEIFRNVTRRFLDYSKKARSWNPFAF